jgi:hypothetical protein
MVEQVYWNEGANPRGRRSGFNSAQDDEGEGYYDVHKEAGLTLDVPPIGSVANMYKTWESKPQIVQVCQLEDRSTFSEAGDDSLVPLFVRRESLPYPNIIGDLPAGVDTEDQVYRNFILGRKVQFSDPNEYVPYPEEGYERVYDNWYHGIYAGWGYTGALRNDPREYRFDRHYPKDFRLLPNFNLYGLQKGERVNPDPFEPDDPYQRGGDHCIKERGSQLYYGRDGYSSRNWAEVFRNPAFDNNIAWPPERKEYWIKSQNKWTMMYYDEAELGYKYPNFIGNYTTDEYTEDGFPIPPYTGYESTCPISGATMGIEFYSRFFNSGVAWHWAHARIGTRRDLPGGRDWGEAISYNGRLCPEYVTQLPLYLYYGLPDSVRGWTGSDHAWLTGFTMDIDPDINWCSTTPDADTEFYES